VWPVGAEQRVAVGEQPGTDIHQFGGVEADQRVAQRGSEQPATVDEIGLEQVHAGDRTWVTCGRDGRVDGGAAAQQQPRRGGGAAPGVSAREDRHHTSPSTREMGTMRRGR
jgi:hypothetical protein